jgi:hypothetical protein
MITLVAEATSQKKRAGGGLAVAALSDVHGFDLRAELVLLHFLAEVGKLRGWLAAGGFLRLGHFSIPSIEYKTQDTQVPLHQHLPEEMVNISST